MEDASHSRTILVAGATGYIGGRLIRALEAGGERLRCLARKPQYLAPRVAASTEVVQADVLDRGSLAAAMVGVDAAFYLVHSMGSAGDFEEEDRLGAENFATAAKLAGVQRLIYLGGLGEGDLSSHLKSRHEVGRILRESGVPTIEFRASVVIGSGSLSFEMIRALVDRLPVMITPRWVLIGAQPIAVEDVIAYLVEALDIPLSESIVVEIGGSERVTYEQMMNEYARLRGLKRLMIRVPVLTPWLSSLWLGLVTPVYATVGRKLIESIRHETFADDTNARRLFKVRPRGATSAIQRALTREDQEIAATRWSDALSSRGHERTWGGVRFGSRLVDSRSIRVHAQPKAAFAPIRRVGGRKGWYAGAWLWGMRGFGDLLFGGPGMRRGRRDPEHIAVGDAIDFWRVEAYEENHLLRLHAEMKLPGRAWLQFEVEGSGNGSTIRQTAIFDPVGVMGLLYWYGLYPFHTLIFAGMLHGIARAAEKKSAANATPP
ncbi:MAG: SDR family oxidoreductase [Chloroflexota bacterium]